jgi:hypothetical protein
MIKKISIIATSIILIAILLMHQQPTKIIANPKYDDFKITINKSNLKEYSKGICQILKHSIDTDLPVSDENNKIIDDYISIYHGANFYDDSFQKKYTEYQRIDMENVWFAAICNRQYFQAKAEGNKQSITNLKHLVIYECSKYISK